MNKNSADKTYSNSLAAFRQLFRPVARVLLRDGVTWKELADVAKQTYVDVATRSFGIHGRPTNISRVALLTGITRREVSHLRKQAEEAEPVSTGHMNQATRVLTGWYLDATYSHNGTPLPLPATGAVPSFESLCTTYAPSVPGTTLLKELRQASAIEQRPDGQLVARTRYYVPEATNPKQIQRFGEVLADLGNAITHNLHRKAGEPPRFERRATNLQMPASVVPEFRDFI